MPRDLRIAHDLVADLEERGRHPRLLEHREDRRGEGPGTVVEGEGDHLLPGRGGSARRLGRGERRLTVRGPRRGRAARPDGGAGRHQQQNGRHETGCPQPTYRHRLHGPFLGHGPVSPRDPTSRRHRRPYHTGTLDPTAARRVRRILDDEEARPCPRPRARSAQRGLRGPWAPWTPRGACERDGAGDPDTPTTSTTTSSTSSVTSASGASKPTGWAGSVSLPTGASASSR